MSFRIMDFAGNELGFLQLSGEILVADLELLRRLGAYRVELMTTRDKILGSQKQKYEE
ncbi:hypothetical protein [Pseudomonas helleri]|uniref:hypothetical protein n=1 Tax=Pseudomonas helleri TaxID=1608996 RepID=UPI003F9D3A05